MPGENEGAEALPQETDIAPAGADNEPEPAEGEGVEGADADAKGNIEDRQRPKDSPDQAERNKTIALRRERDEQRQLKRERDELRDNLARLRERTDILLRDRQAPQAQPQPGDQDAEPDPTLDPIGHQQWMSRQWQAQKREQQEANQAWQRQQNEQQTRQREHQQSEAVVGRVNAEFIQAAQERPELSEALQAFRVSVNNELQTYGLFGQALENERLRVEREHILNADRLGVPIDDYVIRLATARGWNAQGQRMNGQNGQGSGANGDGQGDAATQVQRQARARDAGQSLSRAGGSAAGGAMTADRLLKMSDDEFADYRAKNPSQYRRLMGG